MTSLTLHTSLKALSSNTFGFWEGTIQGFPSGSVGKESASQAGDLGLIPGLGRSSGEGNGYLLQYSCLENSMDRGAWQATIHGVARSRTRLKQLSSSSSRDVGVPGDSVVQNPPANAGDTGSIPRSGRSPGKGKGNLFQYSCLGNPEDRGAW